MHAKEDYIIANRLLVLNFLLSAPHLLKQPDGVWDMMHVYVQCNTTCAYLYDVTLTYKQPDGV